MKDRAFFLYGFAKSELNNIGADELLSFRSNGSYWMNADGRQIREAVEESALEELGNGEEK